MVYPTSRTCRRRSRPSLKTKTAVRITREPSDEIPQGNAIRTDPPAGEEVPVDTTVELFVSAGPEEFEVPNLIGQDEETARRLIEESNFVVGNVTSQPSEQPEGVVISQQPPAGVRAGAGSPIDFVISEGPETFELEDLSGLTVSDATQRLADRGGDRDERYDPEVPRGL